MRSRVPWISCGVAAAMTLFLVGAAFHLLIPWIVPGISPQFKNTGLFRTWDGWTSKYMVLHPIGFGFVFSAIFLVMRQQWSFSRGTRGGLIYGTGVFLVGSLPVYLLNFASFAVSAEIIISWIVQSLAQYMIAGAAVGCVADGAHVQKKAVLPASADRVWTLLLEKDTFLYITQGMVTYADAGDWPSTLFSPGATFRTQVRLFGWGPSTPYEVNVVTTDKSNREIETNESGGFIRDWKHRMRVEPLSDASCRYVDSIELQAGLLTPLVWLFAAVFYGYRQRRWRKFLRTPLA